MSATKETRCELEFATTVVPARSSVEACVVVEEYKYYRAEWFYARDGVSWNLKIAVVECAGERWELAKPRSAAFYMRDTLDSGVKWHTMRRGQKFVVRLVNETDYALVFNGYLAGAAL